MRGEKMEKGRRARREGVERLQKIWKWIDNMEFDH